MALATLAATFCPDRRLQDQSQILDKQSQNTHARICTLISLGLTDSTMKVTENINGSANGSLLPVDKGVPTVWRATHYLHALHEH
jgi:hypothetical protein